MAAGGRPRPNGWQRAGQVFGVLLVCVIVGELSLRFVHYLRPSFIFETGSYERFRGRPNAPNYDQPLNSWGYNDRERSLEKPAGGYRILAIGDSFVFGVVPYRGNFVTLLEKRLVASGRPVEVINMGIPRTNPEDHVPQLAAEGLALEPDAVLQFVYVGNDFGDLRVMRRRLTPYTLDLARFLFGILPDYEGVVFHQRGQYVDEAPSLKPRAFAGVVRRHAVVFDTTWDLDWRLERLRTALGRTSELCREQGLALAVVLLPAEIQVDPGLARLLGNISQLDLRRPNAALADVLGEMETPYLDLLPAFVEAAAHERLYKPNDTHWNLAGNRLAAERIYAWLEGGGSGLALPPVAD